jgi:hypothetical protein
MNKVKCSINRKQIGLFICSITKVIIINHFEEGLQFVNCQIQNISIQTGTDYFNKKKKKLRTREKNSMNGNGKIQDGFLTTETVA